MARRPSASNAADARTPVTFPIPAPEDAVAIASSRHHVCIVRAGGDLACFSNEELKIPEPSTRGLKSEVAALRVEGVSGVKHLAGVNDRFCAAFTDGRVACWQAVLHADPKKPELTFIAGISGAARVSIGPSHGCALERDGHVKCWGLDVDGVLGSQQPPPNENSAVLVSGFDHASQIAVGDHFSCASRGAKVYCKRKANYV